MAEESIKQYCAVLTDQVVCIRHKASREGYLLPDAASLLNIQFHRSLKYVIFMSSSQRKLSLTFNSSSRRKVPVSEFIDACIGLYSTEGSQAQKTLDVTSGQAEVDPAKALLWLKMSTSSECSIPTQPLPYGVVRQERLYSLRDRKSQPRAIILEWKTKSDTIDIRPFEGGEVERFPVAAIDGIHRGRHSEVFGMMRYLLTLHFKDNLHRSLHLALPNHKSLEDIMAFLRSLAKIEACNCLPPASAAQENASTLKRTQDVVNFHYSPGKAALFQIAEETSPRASSPAVNTKTLDLATVPEGTDDLAAVAEATEPEEVKKKLAKATMIGALRRRLGLSTRALA
eukprot:g16174.t1